MKINSSAESGFPPNSENASRNCEAETRSTRVEEFDNVANAAKIIKRENDVLLQLPKCVHEAHARDGLPIQTVTVELAPAWGNLNPATFSFDCKFEDAAHPNLESVELSETVGRNLTRAGLILTDLGRRVTIADHTNDPVELYAVIRALLEAAKVLPGEIYFNIERALDSAPVGGIQGTPQFEPLWDLIRLWKKSRSYRHRLYLGRKEQKRAAKTNP